MTLELLPFVEAFKEAALAMLQEELVHGPLEYGRGAKVTADVSGYFALQGDTNQKIVMTVLEPTAVRLVHTVLGEQVAFGAPIVADTVAEIFNIVVGSAQSRGEGHFSFSLPVLDVGRGHEVRFLGDDPYSRVSFTLWDRVVTLYLVSGS